MRWILLPALLLPHLALAYIPPVRMILERTAENAGSGSYTIVQEVSFPNGLESLTLRETWEIDRNRAMKVTVSGVRDLQTKLRAQMVYTGGQRWAMDRSGRRGSQALPQEFTESFFHWRDLNTAASQLQSLRLIPISLLQKPTPPRRIEEIRHTPEEGVRLSRTGGTIAWAIGAPSRPGSETKEAGLWIEQDQFLIRKIRFPSSAEILADDYSSYARGLQFPRNRSVQWDQNSVSIRLISVNSRGPTAVTANAVEVTPQWDALNGQPAQKAVEEFYSRFR